VPGSEQAITVCWVYDAAYRSLRSGARVFVVGERS
jgi:hypothetical protein